MKKKKKYFIQEFLNISAQETFQKDIEQIFIRNQLQPIIYSRGGILKRLSFLIHLFFRLNAGDIIFFLYPLYSRTNKWIIRMSIFKKCKPICIITDINSLREKGQLNVEINQLKQFQHFILQNNNMYHFLRNKLHIHSHTILPLFDFLEPYTFTERKLSNQIGFAGNVTKSPFLSFLAEVETCRFNIYSYHSVPLSNHVLHFKQNSERVYPQVLQGAFGLVWDGNSTTEIVGDTGKYLELFTPLKTSTYLLATLPIITHTRAAIAAFVLDNKIGIVVNSLHEIADRIQQITDKEYLAMQKNIEPIAKKLSKGNYLQEILNDYL